MNHKSTCMWIREISPDSRVFSATETFNIFQFWPPILLFRFTFTTHINIKFEKHNVKVLIGKYSLFPLFLICIFTYQNST